MKIAVVTPKSITGERGGAENLYEGLVQALRTAGHEATQIDVIVDESSFDGILEAYCKCYYLDLNAYDLVISTKAPTYMIRHRNHISYLLHPVRVFYDMFDVEFDGKDPEKQKQRRLVHEFDKYGLNLARIKKHYVIGEIVAQRMRDADIFWKDIPFEVIYPAPFISEFPEPKPGEFIFLPGRLHPWKRVDLVIQALKFVKSDVKLLLSGIGEDIARLKKLVHDLGLETRVEFLGRLSNEELLDLYSRAIVIPFVPKNEDFGYITIEAFKTKKPVITCTDSGEPARIVQNGVSGFVVEPDPEKLAEKINYCVENSDEASRMGEQGYNSVQDITWSNVVTHLLNGIEIIPPATLRRPINVLITDMQPIEPAIGGGRLRLKGLYTNLGKDINAVYVGSYDWPGEKARDIVVKEYLKEIDVPLSSDHFELNGHLNKLLPDKTIIDSIFPFLGESSSDFINQVRKEAERSDVIVFSHPWLFPAVKTAVDLKNKIVIYDSQNFEASLREQLLGNSPFAKCITALVRFVEMELCEASDLILACSEEDKQKFVIQYHIHPDKVEVVPNGVDAKSIRPSDQTEKAKNKEKFGIPYPSVIFIGSDYQPNVEGGQFIIDTLADKCPEVSFLIVGGVGDRLKSNKRNVRIFGKVTDEEKMQLLSAADIAINPMFNGSGTNIKMFDFLAAGLPTVSSQVGARGIMCEDAFIITDPSNFSQAIRNLLEQPNLYHNLAENGRTLVEKYYDWNVISANLGRRITELYQEELPFFSVVIPTLRGEQLTSLIDKLNAQTFKDFEVIVVDSGEPREAELRRLCNFPLKYVFDRSAGAVKARNIGIRHAEGKVVAFTDDDCQPDADWLENAKKLFDRRKIIGIEGSIYSDESKRNDLSYRIVTNVGFEGLGFMTANLFIKRDIIERIEGFDERFDKPHFREDTDLAWRALEYGEIPFARDVRVFHPAHKRSHVGESKKERDRFFIHDPLLFAKHPEKYLQLIKVEGHFRNPDYWQYFLEGCKRHGISVPFMLMMKDREIKRFIPAEVRDRIRE